ncbi:peroxiredoxin [candidate division Kazan bacterium]|uniref:Peroxiredoxin n=1 Tax=candidate division Kazan bacterium TaxID=2202143 RepID=A0A420ZDK9_UNCK3|nr:MAG: peroxiredoxin [candidate division Kazan bacterium]
MLTVRDKAPDFVLEGYVNDSIKTFKLSNYKGKWVVLFFYPTDFTFVCPTEVIALSKAREDFKKLGAEVFGVSTDSVYSHQAWSKELGELNFPLLSDFNKQISHQYGILDDEKGVARRATFVINPDGEISWLVVSADSVGRSVNDLLRTLEALQTGKLCPADWQPGEKTLN